MKLGRRNFTSGLVVGGATVGAASTVYQYLSRRPRAPRELLVSVASQMQGVHGFYKADPSWNPASAIETESRLLKRLEAVPGAFDSEEMLLTTLQAIMHAEINDGKTSVLNQLVLSQTEADLILIATLYAPAAKNVTTTDNAKNEFAVNPKFGPRNTVVGQVFNEQPDGHGGIWVVTDKALPATTKIEFAGQAIKTTWRSNVVTGAVYGDLLNKVISTTGEFEVALLNTETGGRQVIGSMEIQKRPPPAITEDGEDSTVFCEIGRVQMGQLDDKSILSIKTRCAPRGARILIGDSSIETKFNHSAITADLTDIVSSNAENPWRLFDPISGDTIILPALN